ncbi:hypothetical protein C2S51_014326 [Perilla frutescens var. frutescens]|nr:hypothetical protein C2S51_014326 [Perilla frutescens var. frutescens]
MMDELASPPSSPSQPTSPPDYSAPAEKLFMEHFNRVINRATAELETVYCNYCGREFKWKSQGYGIFIRHLKYNHPDAMDDTSSQGSAEQKFKCDIQISPNQWDAFSNLCQLLKICKEAIEELSGVYYPTSVLVLDNCVKIAILFNSLIGSDDLGGCTAEMMGEWLKYFYDIPNIFLVAKLLDPRVRLDGLEKMLGIYYDALFPVKDDHTPVPSVVVANAKTCLYDLFNEYRTKYSDKLEIIGSSSTSSNDDGSSGDKSLSIRLQNLFDEIKGKRPKRYASNPYEELEAYFTADFEYIDAEFDVLKWWSRRTMSFPIMSLIARDVLAVPASTASVNQTFCLGGYALDERQSTINPQDLEKQILLGDWTRAENRSQENDYDEAEECDTISVGSSDADAVSEDSDNPFD